MVIGNGDKRWAVVSKEISAKTATVLGIQKQDTSVEVSELIYLMALACNALSH
jgi:hypothetical protein